MAKSNAVKIRVNDRFFTNIFERGRTNMERKLGIRLSQTKYTEILAKSGADFKMPRQSVKFIPRKKMRFML